MTPHSLYPLTGLNLSIVPDWLLPWHYFLNATLPVHQPILHLQSCTSRSGGARPHLRSSHSNDCGMTLLGVGAQDQMVLGFTRLLASVEDLALDFPDAAHTLSLFLGRAVVDEALPPSFLAAVLPSLRNDSLGVAVVHATGAALRSVRHGPSLLSSWCTNTVAICCTERCD